MVRLKTACTRYKREASPEPGRESNVGRGFSEEHMRRLLFARQDLTLAPVPDYHLSSWVTTQRLKHNDRMAATNDLVGLQGRRLG